MVAEQTRRLREQNDDLLEFKEDCLEITQDEEDCILCREVYDVYTYWCVLQDIPARFRKKNRSLYEQLSSIPGVYKSDKNETKNGITGRFFYGLKLRANNFSATC